MKNYKVKVIGSFKDKTNGEKERVLNEEFLCDKERYEFLKSKGKVELIEIIEEKKEEVKPVEFQNIGDKKPRKTTKKKNK